MPEPQRRYLRSRLRLGLTARLRCAELAIHRFGNEEVLAVPIGDDCPTPLARSEVDSLRSCNRWLPAAEHAARLAAQHGGTPDAWALTIARWTDAGLLDRLDSALHLSNSDTGGYDAVAIITRDRPELIARMLGDVAREGPASVHVFDQSTDPDLQRRVREAVLECSPQANLHDLHRTREHTRARARDLGIDEDIALSAVLPEPGAFSGGANRNAMMLALRGKRVLVFDDDMRLAMAPSPQGTDAVRVSSRPDPSTFWFPSEQVEVVRHGVLATLAQHLGRSAHSLVTDVEASWWDDVTPALYRKLATADVTATSFGTLGDSGLGSNYAYLYLSGAALQRAASEPATWERLRTSRQLQRSADRVVLTPGPHLMGGAMGLDLRRTLPPFPPVGRGEDGVFGRLLSLSDDAVIAHLPWALLHAPVPARRADPADAIAVPSRLPAIDLLGLALHNRRFPPSVLPADRMRRLGQDIEAIGRHSEGALKDAIAHLWWRRCGRVIGDLERQLEQPGTCRGWQQDVRSALEATRSAATSPPEPEPDRKTAQSRLRRFGRLLQVWPELFAPSADG